MNSFLEGQVYFRVTYPDGSMSIPVIETFVFIGKNLSEEDSEDTWYFEFGEDYVFLGNAVVSDKQGIRVCILGESELGSMHDIARLAAELEAASERRSERYSRE